MSQSQSQTQSQTQSHIMPVSKVINEPLLDPKSDHNFLGDKNSDIWDMYQKQLALMWFPHEVKLDNDKNMWDALSDGERFFLKNILAFFAISDKLVSCNLSERFTKEVMIPEALACYNFQTTMEDIHTTVYLNLIRCYIDDDNEKDALVNAVSSIKSIEKKANWANKWINSEDDFVIRLLAFACIEGIFFSGSFCAIYWMNEKCTLPGLSKANEFIARDEGLHTDFACLLFNNYIKNKPDFETVKALFMEAVDIECEFITESIPCRLLGMNAEQMILYIKFCANRLVNQLNYPKIYGSDEAKQPFPFMDKICLKEKSNFFEDEPSAYTNEEAEEADAYDDIF